MNHTAPIRCTRTLQPRLRQALLVACLIFPLFGHAAMQTLLVPEASNGTTHQAAAGIVTYGEPLSLTIGQSQVRALPPGVNRISISNPRVADGLLVSGHELYLIGKSVGATNVMLWRKTGGTTIINVNVEIDEDQLRQRIKLLLPGEDKIAVGSAADSIILSGEVSSAEKAEQAVMIADAYMRKVNREVNWPTAVGDGSVAANSMSNSGKAPIAIAAPRAESGANPLSGALNATGARVINMMRVSSPQQVMLEVKVAEVSKTLLDKLGTEVGLSRTNGSWTYSILNSLLSDGAGVLSVVGGATKKITIDAEKKDGLLKILAEPNIIAISGQEGSFLAGGKIFIPVARSNAVNGLPTITLEEKEFGVGLKFTPTVLEGGRINLRVAPEVSELSQTGSPFTSIDGTTAVLPSFTTRRAQTTVQLNDGQSFAIAGLIKSNVNETIKRFPVLGEIPILGTLFRSSEFQQDQSELMFIVTPRLVKPLPPVHTVPGDNFVPPSRSEFFIGGKLEGSAEPTSPAISHK